MIEYHEDKSIIVTTECSICGAKRGEGYEHYADHVYSEHTPEDVGLSPMGVVQDRPSKQRVKA